MADVKWIKITTDMFDNRKIKHLRKLPDGNNCVLIWVMLLTMAGRCNANGMIFLTETFPYSTKMLADELDFEENTVKMALSSFELMGMIERQGDFISITGWEEYQNIDRLAEIREYNRLAQQRSREKKRLQEPVNTDVNDMSLTCQRCHETDIDIDKDIDIDIKKDISKDISKEKPSRFTPPSLSDIQAYVQEKNLSVDPEQFMDYYQARDWILSNGKKMKDFRAGLRYWNRNQRSYKRPMLSDISERDNNYEDLRKSIPDPLADIEEA